MIKEKADSENAKNKKGRIVTSSAVMNAVVSESFSKDVIDASLLGIVDALKLNIRAVQDGDMASMEAMLVGQAQALQTVFVGLALKATNQTHLVQYTTFMNLALKAQSQCRATIEALAELKQPKQVAFVKQANISNGHQQVNNMNVNDVSLRAQESKKQPNKLLEQENGEWMDRRETETAIGADKTVGAVET